MEYNSQKTDKERLLAKARRSIAAPFFNFVTENWRSVAATRPNLDGKEVQELLWQQWVGTTLIGRETAGETETGAAIASVKREKGVKRIKAAVVNLERVKLEGRQVEANRCESETKEESLAEFKGRISSELECVAPSRDPHQEDAGGYLGNYKNIAGWGNRPLKADAEKKAVEENARKIKLAAEEAEKWMDEKKQEGEKPGVLQKTLYIILH